MRFGYTDAQRALGAAVRDVLAERCPPEADRRGELWSRLAELGFFGMLVPAEHGGLGLSEVDAVLPLEELGRFAAPGPLLETAVVGPGVLAAAPSAASRFLPRLAAGECAVSVQFGPPAYAVDADVADLALILAREELVCVRGPELIAQPGVDPSRRLFTAVCGGTVAGGGGVAVGGGVAGGEVIAVGDEARRVVDRARHRGALGTAAQLLGLAGRLLEVSVTYAAQRRQFGRPIGAFQAVQHRLADVLLALEFARPLVHRAAFTLSRGDECARRDTSAAAAAAIEAAELAARAALQVHGAIGYTAELDMHRWLRRVWSLRAAWGSARWHRARVADALLGPAG